MRSRTRRVFRQFSPSDFTTFKWEGTASLTHYVTVVVLLAVFLAAELTPFYLKAFVRAILPAASSHLAQPSWVLETPRLIMFSHTDCYGLSQITRLSLHVWQLYSSSHCQPCENYINMSTTLGIYFALLSIHKFLL